MKYQSEISMVVHQDAIAMYKAGAISKERMKEFDEMCLVKEDEPVYEAEKSAESASQTMEHITA